MMSKASEARLESAKRMMEKVVRFHARLSFRQIAYVMRTFGWSRYMALTAWLSLG